MSTDVFVESGEAERTTPKTVLLKQHVNTQGEGAMKWCSTHQPV